MTAQYEFYDCDYTVTNSVASGATVSLYTSTMSSYQWDNTPLLIYYEPMDPGVWRPPKSAERVNSRVGIINRKPLINVNRYIEPIHHRYVRTQQRKV
jgi:hypothetical protein